MSATDTFLTHRPPIVCAIDENYIRPLSALMTSLAQAHPGRSDRPEMIVLHQGLTKQTQLKLLRHANLLGLEIELRQVPPPDIRFPVSGWVSDAVYLRLSIIDALPDVPTVLYMDADTIVCGDLNPLLDTDIDGATLAAVRDQQNPLIGHGIALPGWDGLGLPKGREYFNSGVMLLNLPECRRTGLFETAREFLVDHPDSVKFWDQDALNWAANDHWTRLDRRWNTLALSPLASQDGFVHYAEDVIPLRTLLDDETTAAVLHFAGPDKPWNDDYPAGPIRDRYQALLAGGR